MKVQVDLDRKKYISVQWSKDVSRQEFQRCLDAVKSVPGARFVKGERYWRVPLDMETCRQLRKAFGKALEIKPDLFTWATEAARAETELGSLTVADTGEFKRLPEVLPFLAACLHVGPIGTMLNKKQFREALKKPGSYQVADVSFMAAAQFPGNFNQQGTGKTPEWIGAVWEAGLEDGAHLVIAPSAAVDGTWEPELEAWHGDAPKDVAVFACSGNRKAKEKKIKEFFASDAPVRWLIINTEMAAFRRDASCTSPFVMTVKGKKAEHACRCRASHDPHDHLECPYPVVHDQQWRTICVDETQKGSLRNHRTITRMGLDQLKADKRCAMSGTPSKKLGADIWGILNWLRPDVFTSYWRFAETYFHITDNGFGKRVGKLRKDKEEDLYRHLAQYVCRRLKRDVLPFLPPKQRILIWCRMGPKQERLYRQMEEDGAARLGNEEITTKGILEEYTRLSQFASSVCTVRDGKVVPTEESCKLDAMLEVMQDGGMFTDGSDEKQVVFSESREMIELCVRVLRGKGLEVDVIKGGQTRQGQRRAIREAFQQGSTRVLCVVTQAGGVSLTLDAADVAHFLDESWASDETEQAEDRLHRASRVHQVRIYVYLTRDTIDEERLDSADNKRDAHERLLNLRKKILQRVLT